MLKTLLAFEKVPQLAKTDIAYAMGDPKLKPFYSYEPTLASFEAVIAARATFQTPRAALVQVLKEQYHKIPAEALVNQHIEQLLAADTYTVTTAHQPALFLGPLYFVYKAITTITLAEAAAKETGKTVIPVFVLGSEDHDLEELNHISLFNKTLTWEPNESGAVGSMRTDQVQPLLDQLKDILGTSDFAVEIFAQLEQAYTQSDDFASATQALLHALFGRFGLLVLNMNHPVLKREFIPLMRQELLEQTSQSLVSATADALNAAGFKTQASPRAINLFYLDKGLRERIVLEDGIYKALNTNLVWSEAEILDLLEKHPEHFSPNVVLRPLFQELVLPNLAYVGGGGELAYWLERKTQFETLGIPYPMLVRRNSVLWLDKDAQKKLQKFGFTASEFFEDTDLLVRRFIETNASGEINLQPEIQAIAQVYEQLAAKAAAIDPTLDKAVRADASKTTAALEQWQARLMKAEKQRHEVTLNQLRALKEKLFPGNGLQERSENFLAYYLKYGPGYFDTLKGALQPFDSGFIILSEEIPT